MFCVKCGRPAAAGNFCEEHFLEREKLFRIEDFMVDFCPECKKFDIKKEILNRVKTKNRLTGCEMKTKTVGNKIIADVTCAGYISPLKKQATQKERAVVTLRKRKCENCIKLSGGYYEAAFQVRGENQPRILKKIEKLAPGEMVTDVIKLKEGYDVRITDKRTAERIAKELMDKFSVKKSFKLVGKKKGRELCRNFYAVR